MAGAATSLLQPVMLANADHAHSANNRTVRTLTGDEITFVARIALFPRQNRRSLGRVCHHLVRIFETLWSNFCYALYRCPCGRMRSSGACQRQLESRHIPIPGYRNRGIAVFNPCQPPQPIYQTPPAHTPTAQSTWHCLHGATAPGCRVPRCAELRQTPPTPPAAHQSLQKV
jgi:hypothetical protein